MSANPKMPEIRAVLDQARAMTGQEDTQDFAVEAPRVIARLVQILGLYVGHEPTLAEEAEYERQEHRAQVLAEAAAAVAAMFNLTSENNPRRQGMAFSVGVLQGLAMNTPETGGPDLDAHTTHNNKEKAV